MDMMFKRQPLPFPSMPMPARPLTLIASLVVTAVAFAQALPGDPAANGVTPRTATFDVNTNQNNGGPTESLGVAIGANGNVIIGWEDDSDNDTDIFFFGAVWTLYDPLGHQLISELTITNTPHPPAEYEQRQAMNSFYRAFFRADGTPTPGNTAFGPKIKANRFGSGLGMGASAYYLGFEVPELSEVNTDAGGGADFPAVQLLNDDGTAAGIVHIGDAAAEPIGAIRIADWEYLSNGNIVIVGESRQVTDRALTGQTAGNVPVFRIVTPAGIEVKGYTAVSSAPLGASIWHGVGVTAHGFAVRFEQGGATVRMFDNNGNPTTANIKLAVLTGNPNAGGGGRGDAAGFHGNGRDAYVHLANSAVGPWVTVLNANGTLRWSRKVAEDAETIRSDRMDAAISPDGRVFAVWDDAQEWNTPGVTNRLPQARLFGATGAPVGNRFWVSERDQPLPAGAGLANAQTARVAWRDNCIAVVWVSLNSPETFRPVVASRIFDVPGALLITSIVDNGPTMTINWSGAGPTYSVKSRGALPAGAEITLVTGLASTSFTAPKIGDAQFYTVTSP
jgi:hypothetical protein